MDSVRVHYAPARGATPESELAALAAAYRFILNSAMKEGSRPGAPDDAKGPMHDRASQKYTRT